MTQRVRWLNISRILGLLLVLTYHLFRNALPGGFLGVDVFFTISGYLVTMLAIDKHNAQAAGQTAAWHCSELLKFYRKRFSRVLLPLVLAIVFTLPFALLISADYSAGIGRQLAAAVGFVSNYYEILTGGAYEAQLLPHLYVHTWSLSVEVHLYLAWGFVCAAAGFLFARPRRAEGDGRAGAGPGCRDGGGQPKMGSFAVFLLAVSGLSAAASYLYMLGSYKDGIDTSFAYFNSFSHSFPFLIGSAAAAAGSLKTDKNLENNRRTKAALIAGMSASLVCIAAMARVLQFNDKAVFQYGFIAASLLTASALSCARALHCLAPQSAGEPKVLTAAADLSYYIYLAHWPLYIVFSDIITGSVAAGLTALVAALVISVVLFYAVEPILRGRIRLKTPLRRRAAFAEVAAVTLFMAVLSGSVVYSAPAINSIEESIYSGYILVDRDQVATVSHWAGAINDKPVFQGSPLEKGITPGAVQGGGPVPETASGVSAVQAAAPADPAQEPPPADKGVRGIRQKKVPAGVTVIGDSVCLGAVPALNKLLPNSYINAEGSRQIAAGHALMVELQNRGALREYVVIALGTNTNKNFAEYLTKIIDDLGEGHRLIFVTPYDGRSAENGGAHATAVWERELPSQYKFVTVADWNALVSVQNEVLASDKVHMGGKMSMQMYARCIAGAIMVATIKPAK